MKGLNTNTNCLALGSDVQSVIMQIHHTLVCVTQVLVRLERARIAISANDLLS
jgi:hypothetical protein